MTILVTNVENEIKFNSLLQFAVFGLDSSSLPSSQSSVPSQILPIGIHL